MNLTQRISEKRRELDRLQGEAVSIITRGKALKEEIASLKNESAVCEKVSALLNTIGEERQNNAQKQIEGLVTMGLQTIFEQNLSFHIIQRTGLKSAQVEFIIRSTFDDGRTVDTPLLDARGGGLVATVGFLLRLVIILLSKPKNPLLVLDETFAHVSAEYLEGIADFLKEITQKTDVQIIMITHQTELCETADKLYRFSLDKNGHTKVDSA